MSEEGWSIRSIVILCQNKIYMCTPTSMYNNGEFSGSSNTSESSRSSLAVASPASPSPSAGRLALPMVAVWKDLELTTGCDRNPLPSMSGVLGTVLGLFANIARAAAMPLGLALASRPANADSWPSLLLLLLFGSWSLSWSWVGRYR